MSRANKVWRMTNGEWKMMTILLKSCEKRNFFRTEYEVIFRHFLGKMRILYLFCQLSVLKVTRAHAE